MREKKERVEEDAMFSEMNGIVGCVCVCLCVYIDDVHRLRRNAIVAFLYLIEYLFIAPEAGIVLLKEKGPRDDDIL